MTQKWHLWTAVRHYMRDACILGSHGTISAISPQSPPRLSHSVFPLTLCVGVRMCLSCTGVGLEMIGADAG